MATKKPARKAPVVSRIGQVRGHVGEAKARAAADSQQRRKAGKAPNNTFLNPGDVRGGYDAARALKTTLGGIKRDLTQDDLATFRKNMRAAQRNGITAAQVIDIASTNPVRYSADQPGGAKSDLDKAKKEIKSAAPVSSIPTPDRQSLDVRFLVDSGQNSKVQRRHVVVRFHGFGQQSRLLAATPLDPAQAKAEKALTPRQAASAMRDDYLAFECSCERFKYWFRFVATTGGFVVGRQENGFPKIRNPDLRGVACKHALRSLREAQSSVEVLKFLESALVKNGRHLARQDEVSALAKRQARRPGDIKTTDEKRAERNTARERIAIRQAASRPTTIKRMSAGTRKISSAIARGSMTEADLATLRKFGMTDGQIARQIQKSQA